MAVAFTKYISVIDRRFRDGRGVPPRAASLMTVALLVAAAVAGCGGDSDAADTSAEPSAPAKAERLAPAALAGTYSMTLKHSDLPPNPPPELTDRAEHWTLKIAN